MALTIAAESRIVNATGEENMHVAFCTSGHFFQKGRNHTFPKQKAAQGTNMSTAFSTSNINRAPLVQGTFLGVSELGHGDK
jgi:hypothetical protein